MKRKIFGFLQLLDRYLILNYFDFLILTNLTFFVILFLTLSLYYFNISKTYSFVTLLKYSIFTSLGYYIYIFPLTVVLSFSLLMSYFLKKRFIYVFFSNGIPPKRLAFPFLWVGLLFSFIVLLFFQFIYPFSVFKSKEAYYESKKKVFNTGIAENFWYKEGNKFIYFQLLDLKTENAFRGFKFKVNSDFQLEEVAAVQRAKFEFVSEKIRFKFPKTNVYSFGGVKSYPSQTEEIPYDIKLLKVKKPDFLSLTELIDITLKTRYLELNLNNFVWELFKRLEFTFFVFILTIYSALKIFKVWFRGRLFKTFSFLFIYTLLFYVGIFVFQTLVGKISLNPVYSLGLFLLFAIPLIWEIKKEN